jgi:hypothetical protein
MRLIGHSQFVADLQPCVDHGCQAESLRREVELLAANVEREREQKLRAWQQLQGAVSLAEVCEFLRSATYPDPACGGTRHVSGWQSAAVALEREFGGDREEGTE